MSEYKIICVDDEQDILDYLEEVLNVLGFVAVTFTNPSNAYEYVLKNKKTILMICSDYKMPDMNGYEFRAKLLENNLDHPFFLLTGFYTKELAVEAMRLNISEFISNPNKICWDEFIKIPLHIIEDEFDNPKSSSIYVSETEDILDFFNNSFLKVIDKLLNILVEFN